MSRVPPTRGFRGSSHDIESQPLATPNAEWLEEDADISSERLPSYGEAITDPPPSSQDPHEPHVFRPQPRPAVEQLDLDSPPRQRIRPWGKHKITDKSLLNFSPCLLAPIIALTIGAIFSGVNYVNSYANPIPPVASPDQIGINQATFLIYVIIWALIAYPFTFAFLLIATPQLFGIPSDIPRASTVPTALSAVGMRQSSKHIRNKCCGWYCGLTALYFAIIGVTIWGILYLADVKLRRTMTLFEAEDWAGNYLVVQKTFSGSVASYYSPNGTQLGAVSFADASNGWTMDVIGGPESIQHFFYSDPGDATPLTVNATCRISNGSNSTSNASVTATPCLTGGFYEDPIPYNPGPGHHAVAEYFENINLTTFPPQSSTGSSNAFSPATVWTNEHYYQGIGLEYPPLGSWYLNNTEILQIIWSSNSTRACDGMRINLSKDHEVSAWPILGIIWKWWTQWGEGQGLCQWT